MADKFNLNRFRIDMDDNCFAENFYGNNVSGKYVVHVPYDPYKSAVENGEVLLAKTVEIKELALEMSDNIESPADGTVAFDWFKPSLYIDSGHYDVSATGWDPSGLIIDPSYPDGRSEHFNIIGPTNPRMGYDTDVDTGGEYPAIGTGNPQVWITGDVTFNPGYRQNVVGIVFNDNVDVGASVQFEGCWFHAGFESSAGAGNFCFGCRFDSPVMTTTSNGFSYIECLFAAGTTGSFAVGFSDSGNDESYYFDRCTILGADFFQFIQLGNTSISVNITNCKINGDGVFVVPDPTFVPFGNGKYVCRDCNFYNTGTTAWWDGYLGGNEPDSNEFIRCEGVQTNQATDAARIVFCVDRTNTVMAHK